LTPHNADRQLHRAVHVSAIAVIGGGYVGLTTGACLARLGHDAVCGDVDREKVARLSKGEVPILEEGLPALVAEGLASRRLRFVVGAAEAVRSAEFVFLCVPTPPGQDGRADTSIIEDVVREIAPVLRPGSVVITKSTAPVGTTALVAPLQAQNGHPPRLAETPHPPPPQISLHYILLRRAVESHGFPTRHRSAHEARSI
jgi:nucleotide sugar dehydrogenase